MQLSWVKIPMSDPDHQETPVRPPGTDGKHSRGQKLLRFDWLARLVALQAEAEKMLSLTVEVLKKELVCTLQDVYRDYHVLASRSRSHDLR